MGFPSPSTHYVGNRLCPIVTCGMGADSRVLETDIGFAVIEPVGKKAQGDVLLILCDRHTQSAKLMPVLSSNGAWVGHKITLALKRT